MSLTDLWKEGKLKKGFYYIKISNGKIVIDEYNDFEDDGRKYFYTSWDSDVIEILAPVPSYEELQCVESDSLAKIEGEEIIAELKSKIKHLKDLQANQDKEVESLRDLLKECIPYINDSVDIQMGVGHYPELEYTMLTRINAAIGESEE